jgi:putative transposase
MKKRAPLVNEEFIKERYRSENPLTADEIQNMFKDAFSHIFESCFQSEIEDELGYSKYDYQNKQTDNSRNGYSNCIQVL